VVVANNVGVCLRTEVSGSILVVHGNGSILVLCCGSKIDIEYCSDGRSDRLRFVVGGSSNGKSNWLCTITDPVCI